MITAAGLGYLVDDAMHEHDVDMAKSHCSAEPLGTCN
jgi:hypothetical protein